MLWSCVTETAISGYSKPKLVYNRNENLSKIENSGNCEKNIWPKLKVYPKPIQKIRMISDIFVVCMISSK